MKRMTLEEAIHKAEMERKQERERRTERKQERERRTERKRDGIIRIACAILSGKSGLVNLADVVDKAAQIYNKIEDYL